MAAGIGRVCLIHVLVVQILLKAAQGGYFQELVFAKQEVGKTSFGVLWNLSLYACYHACRNRDRCASFNYQRLGSRCVLNEDPGGVPLEPVIRKSGLLYSRKVLWKEGTPSDCTSCGPIETCHPESPARCSIRECGPPPSPGDDLLVANGNVWRINNTVRYTCTSGYIEVGTSHVIKCLATGSWSVLDSHCQPLVACPTEWHRYENHSYLFNMTMQTWDNSVRSCRELGAHLVHVDNQEEHDFLTLTIQSTDCGAMNDTRFWTAGNDRLEAGQFVWGYPYGTKLGYENWANGEPNHRDGDCVSLSKRRSYRWIDGDCFSENFFICEIP